MNRFIVIEGGDGAGKATQTKEAINALQVDHGVKVSTFSFPRYTTSIAGATVGKALRGEYGDFLGLDPHLASLPFTVDRVGAREAMYDALKKGVVICDRFTPSNAMYQGAKYTTPGEQDEFVAWLERLEYQELDLPKPDLVIYLSVPIEFSRELVRKKEGREYLGGQQGSVDQHESNQSFQEAVVSLYQRTAMTREDWTLIECVRDNELRSVGDIHKEVMDRILTIL